MSETIDDNEEKRKKSGEGEGDSSGAAVVGSGFTRPASDSVARSTSEEETIQSKRRKSGEGESDGAATGTTYVRASGEGIAKLSVEKTKQVWADFRHLDLNEVVAAVAEFFSEFPARASTNCVVAWENVKGIAIVNMAIKFGQDVAFAIRERTRESAVQVRKRYGINIKFKQRGGMAASIPNPQAGLQ